MKTAIYIIIAAAVIYFITINFASAKNTQVTVDEDGNEIEDEVPIGKIKLPDGRLVEAPPVGYVLTADGRLISTATDEGKGILIKVTAGKGTPSTAVILPAQPSTSVAMGSNFYTPKLGRNYIRTRNIY